MTVKTVYGVRCQKTRWPDRVVGEQSGALDDPAPALKVLEGVLARRRKVGVLQAAGGDGGS